MKQEWVILKESFLVEQCLDRGAFWVEEKSRKWAVVAFAARIFDKLRFDLRVMVNFLAALPCDEGCDGDQEGGECGHE